jgi:protein tyrosine phosphatase (PTP) superfamily phosphohydrolase (DUF442 family)/YHS domain-containing protein
MISLRRLSVAFFVGLSCAAVAAAQCVPAPQAPADPGPIRNFLRVNADFCTGGQPRPEHLSKLKAEGVTTIINLRTPGEHRAAEEEALARELGLRYINIPVVYTAPKDEQADEFLRVTDDAKNRPAFIHCTAAIRVGAFWMIRRVLRDGWSVADAEAEAEKIGLRHAPHLTDFARAYIGKHKPEALAAAPPPQRPLAVRGLDPVLLVAGQETPGEAKLALTRGNFEYRFASAENKAKFEKEPERYEVQLNGMCARMGPPVLGQPERFAVYEGRIYLFGTENCRKEFFADPAKYLKPGSQPR